MAASRRAGKTLLDYASDNPSTERLSIYRKFRHLLIEHGDNGIVSEHDSSEEAVRAFARFVARTGIEGAIYRRVLNGWEVH